MAQIPRPPKQGSVTTYVAKVAAGYPRILAGEMDADLDTIYGAWNGGADTVNLRDGCVTSPKLAADAVGPRELADGAVSGVALADGSITTAKLADASVTDAKIVSVFWGKVTGTPSNFPAGGVAAGDLTGTYPAPSIRPGAVTAAQLAPDAVSGASLAVGAVGARELADNAVDTGALALGAVTRERIAIGHALLNHAMQDRSTSVELPSLNSEQLYLDYTFISRGGPYVMLASLHCAWGINDTAPPTELALRIRIGGTAGLLDGTLVREQRMRDATPGIGTVVVPVTLTAAVASFGLPPSLATRIVVSAVPLVKLAGYCRILSGWSFVAEWS